MVPLSDCRLVYEALTVHSPLSAHELSETTRFDINRIYRAIKAMTVAGTIQEHSKQIRGIFITTLWMCGANKP